MLFNICILTTQGSLVIWQPQITHEVIEQTTFNSILLLGWVLNNFRLVLWQPLDIL